jgi:hypothetical protein
MVGDGGSDITKNAVKAEESRECLFFLCSRRFFTPLNVDSIPQAHDCVDPSPAYPHEQMPSREMPVGRVPEAE